MEDGRLAATSCGFPRLEAHGVPFSAHKSVRFLRRSAMENKSVEKSVSKRQIGRTLYIVTSAPSKQASETIQKKLENLILKDVRAGVNILS